MRIVMRTRWRVRLMTVVGILEPGLYEIYIHGKCVRDALICVILAIMGCWQTRTVPVASVMS